MINYFDVIVDLQQGDCGKGAVSNYLVEKGEYTHVVRYNGSNNAGHSVYVDGKKIITHSVPSGVFHGIKSIIGFGCVLNIDHFFNELKDIKNAGVDLKDLVKIANNTHIITEDHLKEDSFDNKIGTTKKGNGPAYRDKYDRRGIRAFEVEKLEPFLVDIYKEFFGDNPCRILFEGAQGFYLDIDWGDYPYVTSSHCTVGSAILNGVPPQKINRVFGVAKIYETYVGEKDFEPKDPIFEKIRQHGNEYGSTTGRARKCNYLNLNNLLKAIRINGVTDLVIRKLDVFKDLNIFALYLDNQILKFESELTMKNFIKNYVKNDIKQIYWAYDPYGIGNKDII